MENHLKITWPFSRTEDSTPTKEEGTLVLPQPGENLFSTLDAAIDSLDTRFLLATVMCATDRILAAKPNMGAQARPVVAAYSPEAFDTLIACIPRHAAQTSFLLLPGGERITALNDGFSGPAISFRLMKVPASDLVEIRHPISRARRLGIAPDIPGLPKCRVLFDRTGDATLDRLTLTPVKAARLGPAARAMLQEMASVIGPPLDAGKLLSALLGGSVRIELAEALLRLLPIDQIDVVARQAMESPKVLALLQQAMPSDPWITESLPALIAWRDHGRPATKTMHSDKSESYVVIPHGGTLRPQAGLAIQHLARRAISPQRNAAILATIREEGAYLLDWISYHRALGFEHLFIYANDNFDGSDDLLKLLSDHGVITWVTNELGPDDQPQVKAYGHALKRLPDTLDYRWTMILDADEYLGLNTGMFPNVQDYIAWQEHQRVDAIALRWLMFSAREDDAWSDGSTVQRFAWREPEVSVLFKTMVRTNQFADSHAHFPFASGDTPFVYRWEDGTVCYHMAKLEGKEFREPKPTANLAWTAHYPYRSMSEMLDKVMRGDAWTRLTPEVTRSRMEWMTQNFFRMATRGDLVEDRRMLRFSERHQAERALIESLPGIAACNLDLKQHYHRKLARIAKTVAAFGKDVRDTSSHGELIGQLRLAIDAESPASKPRTSPQLILNK
jgi:hypothetical protein